MHSITRAWEREKLSKFCRCSMVAVNLTHCFKSNAFVLNCKKDGLWTFLYSCCWGKLWKLSWFLNKSYRIGISVFAIELRQRGEIKTRRRRRGYGCSWLSSSFFEYVCHRRVELPAPRWCWSPSLSYSAKPAAAEADSPKGTSSRPQDFLYNLWRVKVNLANGFIGAPVSFQNGCLGSSGKRLVILQNQHKNSKGGYITRLFG